MLALSSQLNYQYSRSNDNREGIYNIILSICHPSQVVFCYWGISVLKTNTNLIHASSIPTAIMISQEHAKSLFYGKAIRKHQEIQAETGVYSACLIRPKSQRLMHSVPCKYWEENCLRHTSFAGSCYVGVGEGLGAVPACPSLDGEVQAFWTSRNVPHSLIWIAQLIVIQLHSPLGQSIGIKVSGFREVSDYSGTDEKKPVDFLRTKKNPKPENLEMRERKERETDFWLQNFPEWYIWDYTAFYSVTLRQTAPYLPIWCNK